MPKKNYALKLKFFLFNNNPLRFFILSYTIYRYKVFIMDLSDKIIDKKEELLDEFENLTLEEIAIKIKQASNRDNGLIFKIACLAARISVLNQRIQALIDENSANDNIPAKETNDNSNIVEKIIKRSKKFTLDFINSIHIKF